MAQRLKPEPAAASDELLSEIAGSVAMVTLNRPESLNALSFTMLEKLTALLDEWQRDSRVRTIVIRGAGDKAFCAGGDVRAIYRDLASGGRLHEEYFRVEYALDYRIHAYPKPIVAVIDGIVMGGGMGISQGATLRTVGERTRMAMPETAIGLFPDVGGSYFLSRTPGKLGLYLGLAGATIDASDAVYAGLADDFIPRKGKPAPRPGEPQLEMLRPAIDRHFGADSVRAIVASLLEEKEPQFRPWAAQTASALRRRSPTMLEVTFEQLRRGREMTLADCLRMELDLIHGCFEHGDMLEGIRATLIDRDNAPRWKPATLEDVPRASIEDFFAPRWKPRDHPLANLEQLYGIP